MVVGPTPLHLGSRCGSLAAVSCLLANFANVHAIGKFNPQGANSSIHIFRHFPQPEYSVSENQSQEHGINIFSMHYYWYFMEGFDFSHV